MCAAPIGEPRAGGGYRSAYVINERSDFLGGFSFDVSTHLFECFVHSCSGRVRRDWTEEAFRLEIDGNRVHVLLERPSNAVHWRFDFLSTAHFEVSTPEKQLIKRLDYSGAERHANSKTICFLGCARDCGEGLQARIDELNSIASMFRSSTLMVFENDSTDGTAEVLCERASLGDLLLFRESGLDEIFPLRTQRLSYGRNLLLRRALSYQPDYLCVIDLDGVVNLARLSEGLLTCFAYPDVWDAVFPVNLDKYFDLWAFRHNGLMPHDYEVFINDLSPVLPAAETLNYVMRAQEMLGLKNMSGWLRVESAFGGVGLYRAGAFAFSNYRGDYPDGIRVCEHVAMHCGPEGRRRRLYINPYFTI